MKNIAIFGSARSGKSTLSRMIAKKYTNYHIIVGDDIRWAFQDVLPNNNINSTGGSGMKEDFPNFLASYFYKSIKRHEGEFNYIVETCDMSPKKAKELFGKENTILLFLGTPRQSIEEHFNQIRKYQTEKDWSFKKTDEFLLEHCTYWIPQSRKHKKECKELDIWYIDTSTNREEILEETFSLIEKMIVE